MARGSAAAHCEPPTISVSNTALHVGKPYDVTETTGSFAFDGSNQISVSDSFGSAEQMTLSVSSGGILTVNGVTGLTENGNATGTLVLTGSLPNLNLALQSLVYTAKNGESGLAVLSMSDADTADQTNSGVLDIDITDDDEAPTIFAPTSVTVSEDNPLAFTAQTPSVSPTRKDRRRRWCLPFCKAR